MALVKNKKILTENEFTRDPLASDNMQMSAVNATTMPSLPDDVVHDKHQPVFWSLNYILQKLLDNDKFIQHYIDTVNTKLNISENQLTTAFAFENGQKNPKINELYIPELTSHIDKYHSLIDYKDVARDYLKADCENFDVDGARENFQHRSDEGEIYQARNMSISVDVLVEIEYNDSPTVRRATNYVKVLACNKHTGNQFRPNLNNQMDLMNPIPSLLESTYIYKKWLSGLKELYVYMPTSFTFYNETLESESPNPKENATFICLQVNKRHFEFNNIYNIQICGQSLPLQIHKDKVDHFNDVILPSLVRSMCISQDSENNVNCNYNDITNLYSFYFCAYGTDAQAIKIIGD